MSQVSCTVEGKTTVPITIKAETTKPVYTGSDSLQLPLHVQTTTKGMGARAKTPGIIHSQTVTTVASSTNTRPTTIQQKSGKQEAFAAVKEIVNGKSETLSENDKRKWCYCCPLSGSNLR